MEYYERNEKRPVIWALLAAALYFVVAVTLFAVVRFDLDAFARSVDEIIVEFVEPEPKSEPQPPRPKVAEPQMHDHVSAEQNEQQVSGTDQETRTVNPRALFRMNKGGSDEPENAGNPKAAEGETDAAKGDGGGLNPIGNDQLDKGLQGRGLVGALPRPSYPGNRSGKIVIRVIIDGSGRVTKAEYEPAGSTSSDGALIDAAKAAALKAVFTESEAPVDGGTITYYFNLK
ncbi:MAG: energy transducer TonB [Alistipes sp.]|nr:energy transducer TonB [Alistipes sp.]